MELDPNLHKRDRHLLLLLQVRKDHRRHLVLVMLVLLLVLAEL
jgi:hypothetical protein